MAKLLFQLSEKKNRNGVPVACVGARGLVVGVGLITFGSLFDSHCGSFASNLEQAANLLCAQVNSASYPQRVGK